MVWQRFVHLFAGWRTYCSGIWATLRHARADEPVLNLDAELQASLRDLAKDQQCSENELVSDLIYTALAQRAVELEVNMELLRRWESLTIREQQVADLVCRGYTNRQIAVRLDISTGTVKAHVRQVLGKLGFHSKRELRRNMEGRIASSGNYPLDKSV